MQETGKLQKENQKNEEKEEGEREQATHPQEEQAKMHSYITRHKIHQHPPNSNPDC